MIDNVALQILLFAVPIVALDTKLFDPGLALGALLPSGFRTLVATYVYVL